MKRTIVILIAAAVLLGWIILRRPAASNDAHAGGSHAAPDFSLTDISGRKLTLSAYRGKVVVLDFWATWCAPCKNEIPNFVELQERYGPQGLQVIGISMDDDEPSVREFQQQFKMNYPVAVGNAAMAEQYGGILGLPVTFVIDRAGRITARHAGETGKNVFEDEVRKLLAVPVVP